MKLIRRSAQTMISAMTITIAISIASPAINENISHEGLSDCRLRMIARTMITRIACMSVWLFS